MPTSLNIALIEDHESLRKLTARMLEKAGHQVFELACAEDLDTVVAGQSVQLFIIDLNLPGEDGLQFARRLRLIHPGVGVIMLTARGSAEHIAEGYRSGADIYLVKPVSPNMLLAAVESIQRRLSVPFYDSSPFRLHAVTLALDGPGGSVRVNQAEAAVLIGLVRAPSRILDVYQISSLLGQSEANFNRASLEVRISHIRKKLVQVGAEPTCIKSRRLEGYQLCISLEVG